MELLKTHTLISPYLFKGKQKDINKKETNMVIKVNTK